MDPETKRKIAALVTLADEVLAKDGRFPKVEQRVKALCDLLGVDDEGKATVDIQEIATEVDKMKAAQEAMTAQIRFARTPLMPVGLADESHKFSITRALVAHKTNSWDDKRYGFEREALKEIQEHYEKAGSHVIGDDEQGGMFVPDQLIPDWIPAIYTISRFISLDGEGQTRISTISGLTGKAKIPEFLGGLTAYWVGESDTIPKSKAKTGKRTLDAKKLAVGFSITEEMQENAAAFDPLIRREVTRRIAMELDRSIMYGTGGDNMIRGIAATDGIQIYRAETGDVYKSLAAARAVADWDGGLLTPKKLEEMKVAMEEADFDADDSFHTAMSPRYALRLKTTRIEHYDSQADAEKGYLLPPFLSNSALMELIGNFFTSNHIKSNKLPGASIGGTTDSTNEKYTDVLRGNLAEVLLGIWGGIRFKDDKGEGAGFYNEEINMLARMRCDLTIKHKEALVLCPDAQAID